MTEQEAYVAFNLTEKVGSVRVDEMAAAAGGVVAAWEAYPHKVARAGGPVDWQAEFKKAASFGVTLLTPADEAYPRILRETPGHPLCLAVKGSVEALSKPAIALVGTRRATAYGIDQATALAHGLAQSGWMILSGLALGIDAAAHRGALDADGVTVGVLGSALDCFYPDENRELAREIVRKGGAVVSEFPFGRTPDRETFPIRNHVVAALARGVVAVEAPLKSGTLITAGLALNLGRTVMAVPARVDNRMSGGCLTLIRDGARLVRNADDVQEEMSELLPRRTDAGQGRRRAKTAPEAVSSGGGADGRQPDASPEKGRVSPTAAFRSDDLPEITLEESIVLREVDTEGVSLEKLLVRTGLSPMKLNAICMTLRLKGRLRYLPGNCVARPFR